MTPSNANTSGLEVVAWRYRTAPHRDWHETECSEVARVEKMDGSEVEPLHVTAASAQARIADLEGVLAVVSADKGILLDCAARNADRAAEAEARADRLEAALIEALPFVESCEYDNGYKHGAVLRVVKNIQSALQQEG